MMFLAILPPPPPVLKSVQCNKPTQTATHPDNADVSKCEILNFFLTNARSIMNKCDELEIILNSSSPSPVDIAVVTETWRPDQVADEYIAIDGFNLFTEKRTALKGGGVGVYIKNTIPARQLTDIEIPEELECLWL